MKISSAWLAYCIEKCTKKQKEEQRRKKISKIIGKLRNTAWSFNSAIERAEVDNLSSGQDPRQVDNDSQSLRNYRGRPLVYLPLFHSHLRMHAQILSARELRAKSLSVLFGDIFGCRSLYNSLYSFITSYKINK